MIQMDIESGFAKTPQMKAVSKQAWEIFSTSRMSKQREKRAIH
jgi:hypothetical protein